jgi:hypothetical protein
MLYTKHYLVNMPDTLVKQTLCIMPNTNEIANGRFFIINGQHSIAANKDMQSTRLPESIVKHFRQWNCFIVWSKDKSRLRQISGYYNRCNHFIIFKPTWKTNVFGARFIWKELGYPTPPKSATKLGQVVKRLKKRAANNAKHKVSPSFAMK